MRVTTLIENRVADGHDDLSPEFGLSLHVERDGLRILFDTGASGAFADNAVKLGIDVGRVDIAVVSHHHFDHGGGLARFLEINDRATVHLAACADRGHSFRAFGLLKRPIGLDRELLDRFRDRFEEVSGRREIAPGVVLLAGISGVHPRPRGNRRLFVERDGELVRDPFDHELVMVVEEADGIVVFTGCSHSGILNMIDAAVDNFPGAPVKAVFGGFHLIGLPMFNTMAASRREVAAVGRLMLDRTRGMVCTGHCTGARGFAVLKREMGDRLRSLGTGTSIDV